MNSHAPGPWEVEVDEDGKWRHVRSWDDVWHLATVEPDPRSASNAQLIAAAPDLLEALETMVEVTELLSHFQDPERETDAYVALLHAREAIKRARGEPNLFDDAQNARGSDLSPLDTLLGGES
jgi:hypothetical protein